MTYISVGERNLLASENLLWDVLSDLEEAVSDWEIAVLRAAGLDSITFDQLAHALGTRDGR